MKQHALHSYEGNGNGVKLVTFIKYEKHLVVEKNDKYSFMLIILMLEKWSMIFKYLFSVAL